MSTAARIPDASLLLVVEDREWIDFAICGTQGHLFFEPWGERPSARRRREARAKHLCARCPVQEPCREAGRRNRESGVWGGENEEERAQAGFAPRGNARRSVIAARKAQTPPPPTDRGDAGLGIHQAGAVASPTSRPPSEGRAVETADESDPAS